MEHIRPNFPTTTVRKTATVATEASAEDGAGHMSTRLVYIPCSARCAGNGGGGGVAASAFHVPFIVALLHLRGPGDFFSRTHVFAMRRTARKLVNVFHTVNRRRRRRVLCNNDDSGRAIIMGSFA